ncbi:hypothetical protein J1N35_005151 [Gossypium stocksii]|uniref:Uncharacterized protein n=1 Tax=Gossypium stocksii TaxID=47602 RepID=A0A9D3WDA3_9ROSI|nr:hypothetical protein J1N35_005151 [Gossypium stocksii]
MEQTTKAQDGCPTISQSEGERKKPFELMAELEWLSDLLDMERVIRWIVLMFLANEDAIPKREVITKKILMRFLGEEMPHYSPPGFASTSSTPTRALETPSIYHNAFEKHVLNSLEKLYKQFSMFEK